MMQDPCLFPHHLHLPTAYIYLQLTPRHTLFYQHRHTKLVFTVPAPLCYPQKNPAEQYALVHHCSLTKNHIIKNSRTARVKLSPGAAAMPQPGIFPFTKKNDSQQSVTHIMLPYLHLVLQYLLSKCELLLR